MNVSKQGNMLVVEIPLEQPRLSKSGDYHLRSFLSFECGDKDLLERITEMIEFRFRAKVLLVDAQRHRYIVLPYDRNDKYTRHCTTHFLAGCDFAEGFERVSAVKAEEVPFERYYDHEGALI